MRKRNRLLVLTIALFSLILEAPQAFALPYDSTLTGTGCKATLTSPYENFPTEGAVPLSLEIQNDQDQPGVWILDFEDDSRGRFTSLTCQFKVQPHATEKFAINLPLAIVSGYSYVSLRPTISGPGIRDRFEPITLSHGTNTTGLLSAISNSIHGKVDWSTIASSRLTASKTAFNETGIDTKNLPSSWEGLCGLGSLMLTDSDWLALTSDQRVAVLDYVAMGGRLAVFMKAETAAQPNTLGLPIPPASTMPSGLNYAFRYGAGYIGLEPKKDLATLGEPELEDLLITWVRKSQEETAHEYIDSTWAIGRAVGNVTVNAPLIIFIVLGFSTLVGPINLIYFAPANNRIRLFWTTPLISIGASTILLFGILVGDGLGGKGRQAVVIYSLPQLNQEIVLQEQAARTAVLMSTGWQNKDDALVLQIPQSSNSAGENYGSSDTYHIEGQDMSGNWFKSRSISWQFMRSVRPTRSHLSVTNLKEVIAGKENPKLVSSFPDTLKEVHVTIGTHFWVAKNVAPGQLAEATSERGEDRKAFFEDCRDHVGTWLKDSLKDPETLCDGTAQDLAANETFFMAEAEPDDRQVLHSLEAIKWQVDAQIYAGPLVDQEEASHE